MVGKPQCSASAAKRPPQGVSGSKDHQGIIEASSAAQQYTACVPQVGTAYLAHRGGKFMPA